MTNDDCMVINLTTMQAGFLTDALELLLMDMYPLVNLLAPPNFPKSPLEALRELKHGANLKINLNASDQTKLSIYHLPPELLAEVFDHITDYFDAVIFGMTCSYVWGIGDHRIRELFVQHHAPWKGQRILCLTEWAEDLPEAFCTMDQLEEITQKLASLPDMSQGDLGEGNLSESINITARRLLAEGAFSDNTASTAALSRQLYKLLYGLPYMPSKDNDSYRSRWTGIPRGVYHSTSQVPWSDDWFTYGSYQRSFTFVDNAPTEKARVFETKNVKVLLNQSKRVYVRSDSLYVHGRDVTLGLGRACLWWICHGPEPWEIWTRFKGSLGGAWVGDCFDILCWEEFIAKEGDIGKSGWTDVSAKVREEMLAIMKSTEATSGLDWSTSLW